MSAENQNFIPDCNFNNELIKHYEVARFGVLSDEQQEKLIMSIKTQSEDLLGRSVTAAEARAIYYSKILYDQRKNI